MSALRLAVFDLDHTLLDGDSDQLWCEFLQRCGVLDAAVFGPRNAAMAAGYRAGTVSVQDFCDFYVGTLAGRSAAEWEAVRQEFLADCVAPSIPRAARQQVQAHRDAGDLLVLSTATNRYITELTATFLGFEHLIATECETGADGRFTGRTQGVLNMREGKVTRLRAWLGERGQSLEGFEASVFYSDSANDLPLLQAVREAVVVNPDARLADEARRRGWRRLDLLSR